MHPSSETGRVLETLQAWAGYPGLKGAMERFADLDVYLAGGVVRDTIAGRAVGPKDFDFFIDGPTLSPALDWLRARGELSAGPFGSPRWYPEGPERIYCDIIPIKRFTNGLWPCEDIIDALNQFDFTGNAVALDLRTRRWFDPQNGCRDIRRGIVRAVRFDYPDEPIVPGHPLSRPAVHWYRLLHYAQVLGWQIEPVTLGWLRARRGYESLREVFASVFFEPHELAFQVLGGPLPI
jgi:hypothetical protein